MSDADQSGTRDLERRVSALEDDVARLVAQADAERALRKIAAPVAVPILAEAGQYHATGKFFCLLDTAEYLVKYSAAIAFAHVVKSGGQGAQELMQAFGSKLTLGRWVEEFRKILDGPAADEWPLQELRSVFRTGGGRPSPIARYLLDEFIAIRNREKGHGAHQPDGYYENLYMTNRLVVRDCVTACKHIEIQLVQIQGVAVVEGSHVYQASSFMGPAPVRLHAPISSGDVVPVKSLCLWSGARRLLQFDDFVSHRNCHECHVDHIFFLEQLKGSSAMLHSSVGNHRMEVARTR